jgi:predicted nucleotidyltransferase component of viral defense system
LFDAPSPGGELALRGGTALNKLYVQPACRYSEDIDLVQTRPGPIGACLDAVRAALDPWLGHPVRSRAEHSVTLTYRFASEIAPVRPLRLKIEINTREHFAVLDWKDRPLVMQNPWFTGQANVRTYELDELMGTKMRALFQRRKGRDLFDLWLCLSRQMLEPARVLTCFNTYLDRQGLTVTRAEFERNLYDKERIPAFMEDIRPLLRADVEYDPRAAVQLVRRALIDRLPGEPWRGPPPEQVT